MLRSSQAIFWRLGILVLEILFLAPLVASAEDYRIGDKVEVTQNAPLRLPDQAVGLAKQGEILTVKHVKGKWLWVSAEAGTGWLDKQSVVRVTDRASKGPRDRIPVPVPADIEVLKGPWRPLYVVSLSTREDLVASVDTIGESKVLAAVQSLWPSHSSLALKRDQLLELVVRPDGLRGLAADQPWGSVLETNGLQFRYYAFVPVVDFNALLNSLEPVIGQASRVFDNVYRFDFDNVSLYVKRRKGWAFLGVSAEALDAAPDDPVLALDGLNREYGIAWCFYVNSFSPLMRNAAASGLRSQLQESPPGGLSTLTTPTGQIATRLLASFIEDVDEVQLGIRIDGNGVKRGIAELTIAAGDSTPTAQWLGQLAKERSAPAGLALPDAALAMRCVLEFTEADRTNALTAIADLARLSREAIGNQRLGASETQFATSVLNGVMALLRDATQSGRVDLECAVVTGPVLLVGGQVDSTAQLERSIRDLLDYLQSNASRSGRKVIVNANAGQVHDVRLQALSIADFAANNASGVEFLLPNKQLDAAFGVGKDRVYLAIGTGALPALKRALADPQWASVVSVPSLRLAVDLDQMLTIAGRLQGAESDLLTLAEAFRRSAGQDKVKLSLVPAKQGVTVRVEFEDDVVQLARTMSLPKERPDDALVTREPRIAGVEPKSEQSAKDNKVAENGQVDSASSTPEQAAEPAEKYSIPKPFLGTWLPASEDGKPETARHDRLVLHGNRIDWTRSGKPEVTLGPDQYEVKPGDRQLTFSVKDAYAVDFRTGKALTRDAEVTVSLQVADKLVLVVKGHREQRIPGSNLAASGPDRSLIFRRVSTEDRAAETQTNVQAKAQGAGASQAPRTLKPGDRVVVTHDAELRLANRPVERVKRGDVLIVERVNGKWLWVRAGDVRGWLENRNVGPFTRANMESPVPSDR